MDSFETLRATWESGGVGDALDFLIAHYRETREYSRLFEARLMKKRCQMGLPLTGAAASALSDEQRQDYDGVVSEAARETGRSYLDAGNIPGAWPYYRALGDIVPVKDAIERYDGGADHLDQILEIALGERVHPRRGFELLLQHQGTCRAITCFDGFPADPVRDECLNLLMRRLHGELVESLKRVIERHEGAAPATNSVPELLAGRDWLFGEYDYYVDTSHLVSLLRFALDSQDPATIRLGIELAEYGKKLAPMFHYKNDPPFDDMYVDHAIYLRALVGEDADAAVAHFRKKAEATDPYEVGTYPAQVLVRFLLRLDRKQEAVEVFEKHLEESDPAYLSCPTLVELCQMAGDSRRLRELARERGDYLAWVAASV